MSSTFIPKIILLLAMSIAGCSIDPSPPGIPAAIVQAQDLPVFADDLKLDGLSTAVTRQLAELQREHNREALRIGKKSYSSRDLAASLRQFNKLVNKADTCLKSQTLTTAQCNENFGKQLHDQFLVYRLWPSLLTAYYTPTIEVSTEQSEQFKYPIYRTPDTARERHYSRRDIDFSHKLDGRGYELYYAADRFDIYVANIEGGAKLDVNDNGRHYTKYLHYNADNGQEFTDIYDYMVNHGMIASYKHSRFDQRAVLSKHPDLASEIFSSCPGYVFFKASDRPVISHTGVTLTDNRSLATDPAYYRVKGAITYVTAPLPLPPAAGTPPESNPSLIKYGSMHRFFIDQDIGHHIIGPARADLFFGEGQYAEFLANNFMTMGTIYLLILK